MGSLLGLIGLAALVVSLVGLVRGHVRWARIFSRKTAAAAAVASLVVVVVAAAITPSRTKDNANSSVQSLTSPTPAVSPPTPTPTSRISHAPDGTAMPDRTLTPGSALTTAAAVVCASGYLSSIQDVGEDLRRSVYAAYAVDHAQRDGYELDHLVPVELGGDNSERNLWPQPRTGPGAAAVKNGLESHLQDLVCAGTVPLAEVQQAIAADWSAANVRYGPMTVPPPSAPATAAPPPTSSQPVPDVPAPPTYTAPRSTQPPPQRSTAPPAGGNVVHPGAFCKPAGATGVTVDGTPMVCGPASDGRNRWHSG